MADKKTTGDKSPKAAPKKAAPAKAAAAKKVGDSSVVKPETDKVNSATASAKRQKRRGILIAVVCVALLFAGVKWLTAAPRVVPVISTSSPNVTVPSSLGASGTTEASNTVVAPFVINMPRREGHRLNADGVKVHDNAKAFRDQIANQAMHDPLTLFVYYNFSPLGENPIQNVADLAKGGNIKDGNVFSEEGKKRYNEWIVLWRVADIKSVSEITFQGNNTGVSGTSVTQSNGVTGKNKAGYDIRYRDAQGHKVGEHSALERCTQPTGKSPGFKPGPTDNQKPPPGGNTPKDGSQDPARKGNAPVGGGHNDTPGPGKFIPPEKMVKPPSTPRVNPPAPPAPQPAGSTPDPIPAPAPEQPADRTQHGHSGAPGSS